MCLRKKQESLAKKRNLGTMHNAVCGPGGYGGANREKISFPLSPPFAWLQQTTQ